MTKKSHSEDASELSQASAVPSKAKVSGKESTPIYELGFHVVPTVQDEGVEAVIEKIRTALDKAEIINEEFPVRMTLAYTVERSVQGKREKYNESYFGFIKFAMERSAMKSFETSLRATPEVLRFLIIETVREDVPLPRRTVFSSSRLEGETIKKPETPVEKTGEVSDEELDKTLEALVSTE